MIQAEEDDYDPQLKASIASAREWRKMKAKQKKISVSMLLSLTLCDLGGGVRIYLFIPGCFGSYLKDNIWITMLQGFMSNIHTVAYGVEGVCFRGTFLWKNLPLKPNMI